MHRLCDCPPMNVREEAVQRSGNVRFRREQVLVQLNVERAALLPVWHLVSGQVLLRVQKFHAAIAHGLMARLELLRGDEHVLVRGHTVVRVGVQLPADDSLYDNGRYPGGLQFGEQPQERVGFHGLHHDRLHGLTLIRQKDLTVRFPGGRAADDRRVDHRQHAVGRRHGEQCVPCLPLNIRLPIHGSIFQRGAERLQK